MAKRGKSFTVSTSAVGNIIEKYKAEVINIDKRMKEKMEASVNLVYAVARSRRGYTLNKRGKRVSDPNASYGVPVAAKDGGTLRSGIKKETTQKGDKTIGRIWVDGVPYAAYLEFGTSKMAARPFLRPAIELNKQNIKRIFEVQEK